jgi:PAS domain S-box-containing protein
MTPEPGGTIELKLRAAVESSPSGLLMIDADGIIVLVNREIERLFGYAREELLGRPVEMLVPDRFRDAHPGFRGGFLSAPRIRAMGAGRELFGLRKDGSEVPVEIGLTPIATSEGFFVISSVVDISARRQAEARFRAAVESSPNGMVMIDDAGRIVLVNREVERLFGYAREDLLGRSLEVLVPERFRPRHPGFRDAFFADPQTRSMGAGRELFGLRQDGSEVPVEIGLNPIQTDEGVFVLSSIVDISSRKQAEQEHLRLEEQLRQSQKMEALGRLAGGIAHDFNNILGAIVGYAELVREEITAPAVVADVDEVLRGAARGKELVDRILRFSRRQDVVPRAMDLAQVVREVTRLLRATLPASIDIRLGLNPSTPRVMADATSVHQILMNLATNASHAMETGGVLDIDVQPFHVRDSFARANPGVREGLHVLLTVRDTGRGMDAATRARAFEPFFTTKAPGTGSGLGLALVHGILRDHGGTVWLDSEVGEGTTVSCVFPALEAEASEELSPSRPVPRGHGQRILFLDDERSLAAVGERRLQALGYEVTTTTDPTDALEIFRDAPGRFDLIVTDYSMPRMDGLEFARNVSAIRSDIPILLMTGYMEEFPDGVIAATGVRKVLSKPVNLATLGETVSELLSPH